VRIEQLVLGRKVVVVVAIDVSCRRLSLIFFREKCSWLCNIFGKTRGSAIGYAIPGYKTLGRGRYDAVSALSCTIM
jgi:hypothetical protein